jgi:LCP family protein required for cell wall assembly
VTQDLVTREQRAREAGRKAQINTVRQLLRIPIDHFIEVTLGAFFQIARAVEPITVCLNEDTSDTYSGAAFHQGVQQIDAAQAMAFVRQRRDASDELNFTDQDRTRRQQAFIASLVSALRQGGALSDPATLANLLAVAKQNIAVDAGFDLVGFAQHAATLTAGSLSLYTLPIVEFGQDPAGEDVNVVDVTAIRAIVGHLVDTDSIATTSSTPPSAAANPQIRAAAGVVLNVVNATTQEGLAGRLETAFATRGFTAGTAGTADSLATASTIEYGTGADDAGQALAGELGMTTTASGAIPAATVQLSIGTDFPADQFAAADTTQPSATPAESLAAPVTPVAATATGTSAPLPTDLTQMTATAIPCVK